MNNNTSHKSKTGGQALIEGIMMRGVKQASMAVRKPDGEIDLEIWDVNPPKWYNKVPIIRGVVNFAQSMVMGYKCLSKSAEKAGFEEDENETPSKFEQFLERKLGEKLYDVITIIGTALGIILAITLFLFVPSLIVKGIDYLVPLGIFKAIVEGIIKIVVFVLYLWAVSKMKMIQRMYEYHGAEHKTIFCFENGLDLTVENIRTQSRFHPRCGTSFLIIVLILSILIFSVVSWESLLVRTALKLALLPLTVGIAYEFIKLAGRHDNWFTRAISFPGIKLQHLTTREPDDSQIEVAIAAIKAVIPDDLQEDKW